MSTSEFLALMAIGALGFLSTLGLIIGIALGMMARQADDAAARVRLAKAVRAAELEALYALDSREPARRAR